MQFNSADLGHRYMLALAIQDFLNQPGAQISGKTTKTKISLVDELRKAGVVISRNPLKKLGSLHDADRRKGYGPEMAARVASALEKMGFWPAGRDIERSLRRLPAFYNGFDAGGITTLNEIVGDYVSYQYSSRIPSNILIGRLSIGARTPWGYAPVRNYIENTGSSANSLTYTGITWSDNLQNIYMLLRVEPYGLPTFILLEDIERPKGQTTIVSINGTALGAGRQHHRHLTSLSLHRSPYPETDSAIEPHQHDRLPSSVRVYMTRPLKNGPSNL